MQKFLTYCNEQVLSKLPESEKAKCTGLKLPFSEPEELAVADSVGVIFDETEGLNIYGINEKI